MSEPSMANDDSRGMEHNPAVYAPLGQPGALPEGLPEPDMDLEGNPAADPQQETMEPDTESQAAEHDAENG